MIDHRLLSAIACLILGCRPSPPGATGRTGPTGAGAGPSTGLPTGVGVGSGAPTTPTTAPSTGSTSSTSSPCATPGPSRRLEGTIELSTGAYEAKIYGLQSGDSFGYAMGAPGDVNGDGLADLLVNAVSEEVGTDRGLVYLLLGPLSGVMDAHTAGVRIGDPDPGLGTDYWAPGTYPSATVGDLDGDGLDDVVVGTTALSYRGVHLVTGFGGAQPGDIGDMSAEYARFTATDGATIGVGLGHGDLTGDGIGDLVIGDSFRWIDDNSQGTAYIIPGPIQPGNQDVMDANPVMISGSHRLARIGATIQVASDLDGDGLSDLVVSGQAPSWDTSSYAGLVFVFFGPVVGGYADEIADKTFYGETSLDILGEHMAVLGDADGDGLDELVLGAWQYVPGTMHGAAYLVRSPIIPGPEEVISSAASATYHGVGEEDQAKYVWPVRDLDQDGLADLAVGAYQVGTRLDSAVFLLYGPLPDGVHPIDQVADATIYGEGGVDLLRVAATPGDMDGDCMPELALGAAWAGPTSGGAVYILKAGTW